MVFEKKCKWFWLCIKERITIDSDRGDRITHERFEPFARPIANIETGNAYNSLEELWH